MSLASFCQSKAALGMHKMAGSLGRMGPKLESIKKKKKKSAFKEIKETV